MESESTVYFVFCPECGDRVPLPPQAVGPNRSDLWNVVTCLNCSTSFDYDCIEVLSMPLTEWQELIFAQDWTEAI